MRYFFLLFLIIPIVAPGQTAVKEKLEQIERQRFEAMVNKDFGFLEKVLSEDLIYTHSNGLQETKTELIKNIQTGKLVYRSISPEQINVRLFKKCAVLNGIINVNVVLDGRDVNIRLRYLNTYIRQKGDWRLVAWQSARLD
jgi:hypothetical protein